MEPTIISVTMAVMDRFISFATCNNYFSHYSIMHTFSLTAKMVIKKKSSFKKPTSAKKPIPKKKSNVSAKSEAAKKGWETRRKNEKATARKSKK